MKTLVALDLSNTSIQTMVGEKGFHLILAPRIMEGALALYEGKEEVA